MAARANRHLEFAYIRPYTVETGQTVVGGKPVKFGSSDTTVQDSGAASDLMIGVARNPGTTYTAGQTVEVVHPFTVVVPMVVGTGGSTRGLKQKVVSDGITDVATLGGATTPIYSIGIAMQSGVAGDYVGVGLLPDSRVGT